jgi:hypothetical protein
MVVDLSAGDQRYVEDCEVCCQPMEVDFAVSGEVLSHFDAQRMDD